MVRRLMPAASHVYRNVIMSRKFDSLPTGQAGGRSRTVHLVILFYKHANPLDLVLNLFLQLKPHKREKHQT